MFKFSLEWGQTWDIYTKFNTVVHWSNNPLHYYLGSDRIHVMRFDLGIQKKKKKGNLEYYRYISKKVESLRELKC